jgi:hypothetical protein
VKYRGLRMRVRGGRPAFVLEEPETARPEAAAT